MNSHASRFVHRNNVVVLIEDIEGDGFRFSPERRPRLNLNLDALAGPQPVRSLRRTGIDQYQAGFDQFLHPGPA
jgi:hypothetical protein